MKLLLCVLCKTVNSISRTLSTSFEKKYKLAEILLAVLVYIVCYCLLGSRESLQGLLQQHPVKIVFS